MTVIEDLEMAIAGLLSTRPVLRPAAFPRRRAENSLDSVPQRDVSRRKPRCD
jgi:hypothetical protein